jgi:hypothetical protein
MQAAWQKIEHALNQFPQLLRAPLDPPTVMDQLLAILRSAVTSDTSRYWQRDNSNQSTLRIVAGGPAIAPESVRTTVATTWQLRSAQEYSDHDGTVHFFAPVTQEESIFGVLEIAVQRTLLVELGDGLPLLLSAAAQVAGAVEARREQQSLQQVQQQQADVLELLRITQGASNPQEFAYRTVQALVSFAGCERAAMFAWKPNIATPLAVSGIADVDSQAPGLIAWSKLASRLATSGESYWLSARAGEQATELEELLAAVRESNQLVDLALIPLVVLEGDQKFVVGAVALEWFTQPAGVNARSFMAFAAPLLAPPWMKLCEQAANPFSALSRAWFRRRWRPVSQAFASRVAFMGMAIAVLALSMFIPVPFTIEAQGELQPDRQQHVFATADGVVCDIESAASRFEAGAPLLRLENKVWQIERDELRGELARVQQELLAAKTQRLREADGPDANSNNSSTARIEQLEVQQRDLHTQVTALEARLAELLVRAPQAGSLITWEWERQLAGRPVRRGDQLCTVADLEGPWHVALQLPDRESFYVVEACERQGEDLAVSMQLGHDPLTRYTGVLQQLAPAIVATPAEPPHLEARVGQLMPPPRQPRPGVTVRARIHCGSRPLGFVWLRPLWEWCCEHF